MAQLTSGPFCGIDVQIRNAAPVRGPISRPGVTHLLRVCKICVRWAVAGGRG
jgi:hypothetical protein